jgi:hypothetical protein
MSTQNQKPWMVAYTVIKGKTTNFWKEVGVAFQNKDGSWNLELFSVPISGKINLRVPRGDSKKPAETA